MTTKLRSTCPHLEVTGYSLIMPVRCKACGALASQVIDDLRADLGIERAARKLAIEALSEINRQVGKAFGGSAK